MVIMDNLQFYLLKRSKTKRNIRFLFQYIHLLHSLSFEKIVPISKI